MQYALEWLKCQPILMGMLDSSKLYAAASASSGYPTSKFTAYSHMVALADYCTRKRCIYI